MTGSGNVNPHSARSRRTREAEIRTHLAEKETQFILIEATFLPAAVGC